MLRAHRRLPLAAVILTAAVAFPLGTLASHQFTDVPDSNQFHADIDAVADAGVTTGCGGTNYCPSAFVTREQMAAFMNRLGALAPGKTPVVNADKVDGLDSSQLMVDGDLVLGATANWLPTANANVTITHFIDSTAIEINAGDGEQQVHLGLPAPSVVGDTPYGLQSVEVCHGPSIGVDIVDTTVIRLGAGPTAAIVDPTDRTMGTSTCYEVTDVSPDEVTGGGATLTLLLDYHLVTNAFLRQVTVTWVPIP